MFQLGYVSLFIISIFTSWATNFLRGLYSRKFPDTEFNLWNFNFWQNIFCLIGVFAIGVTSGGNLHFSMFSVLLGVIVGFANVIGLDYNMKALANGPLSYTTVIVSLSCLIPTVSGIFFGESMTLWQILGVLLMVVCIVLSPSEKEEEKKADNTLKWLIFCFVAAFCIGFLGIIQKVHQSSAVHREEMTAFLVSLFFISAIFSGIKYFNVIKKEKKEKTQKFSVSKSALIIPALCGISYSFPHTVNLFLVGELPTVIFFPIANVIPMILFILSGLVIFKEKITLKSWIGIVVGIISTVLVSGVIG